MSETSMFNENKNKKCAFQSNKHLFRKYLELGVASSKFQQIESRLDEILVIGDRVIEACKDHDKWTQLNQLNLVLSKMNTKKVDEVVLKELKKCLQTWFNVLNSLVIHEPFDKKWIKEQAERLEQTAIRFIRLKSNYIQDDEVKLIMMKVIQHEDLNHFNQEKVFTSLIMLYLFPLYIKYEAIRNELKGLIISTIQDQKVYTLLKYIANEREYHLKHFAGREKWIDNIIKILEDKERTDYLLLSGSLGFGKTALTSKLTEKLTVKYHLRGNLKQTKDFPWLPGVLLHLGKQSNQPKKIVNSLVAQANSLLINPIVFEDIDVDSTQSIYTDHLEYYKKVLYITLDRVVQERGEVILIIDALDEMCSDGVELAFLPDMLPKGAKAFLTVRAGSYAEEWIMKHRPVDKLSLSYLMRSEIPLITGFDDTIEKNINDQVWEKSSGMPVLVSYLSNKLKLDKQVVLKEYEESIEDIFWEQIQKWRSNHQYENNLLKEIIMMLAIFEPIAKLEIKQIESYLKFQGFDIDQDQIFLLLNPVAEQIESLDQSKIKLRMKGFARFILFQYCSVRDVQRQLEKIIEWLARNETISTKTLASFLNYWTNKTVVPERCDKIVETLLILLIENGRASTLLDAIQYIIEENNFTSMLGYKGLKYLSQANHVPAMIELGNRLIDGNGVIVNKLEGEEWLRKAAKAGYITAMVQLGNRLFEGNGLTVNKKEGEEWLRRAAKSGNAFAMKEFGLHLLKKRHVEEAEQWFRKAAENGNRRAMKELGVLLINDNSTFERIKEGEKWLLKAAEKRYPYAMEELGVRLIDGRGLEQDIVEGEKWLRKAIEIGHPSSMYELGIRLIDGRGLIRHTEEGESWLRKAAALGHIQALKELGIRLIEGKGIERNIREGAKWLQKASITSY